MRKSFVFLGSLILGLCGLAQGDLNDGLVAYYPFDGNANDTSGNGRAASVVGATLTADRRLRLKSFSADCLLWSDCLSSVSFCRQSTNKSKNPK